MDEYGYVEPSIFDRLRWAFFYYVQRPLYYKPLFRWNSFKWALHTKIRSIQWRVVKRNIKRNALDTWIDMRWQVCRGFISIKYQISHLAYMIRRRVLIFQFRCDSLYWKIKIWWIKLDFVIVILGLIVYPVKFSLGRQRCRNIGAWILRRPWVRRKIREELRKP